MFKSILIQYITAMLLIIMVSFVILLFIITAFITNYSIETKQDTMYNTALVAGNHLKTLYPADYYDSFADFLRSEQDLISSSLLDYTQFAEDSHIFITDTDGNIIVSTHGFGGFQRLIVDNSIMNQIKAGGSIAKYSTFGDVFYNKQFVFYIPIRNNDELVGVLFINTANTTLNSFVGMTTRVIIISFLSVLLATMVTIYLITDRIISPLRAMSKAAKSFAMGHFDVRIKESGNDEVSELANAFNNMAASLAKNEEVRRAFLSNVSHDLRTPMTTIAGFIDGILYGTIPPEKHEYYLGIVAGEIRRLSRLVASMLDITRIQAGERKFNMAPFDICETARLILISFEQKINDKQLEVEFLADEDKMMVFADADAIHQVMYNLIENAIKFSFEKGILRVGINKNSKDKKVCLEIYNTGEGISQDDLPYVFDRFYKSDPSRGLDKSGVGLGLFIVKTITDAHEAKIHVVSEFGKFCAFRFALPRA